MPVHLGPRRAPPPSRHRRRFGRGALRRPVAVVAVLGVFVAAGWLGLAVFESPGPDLSGARFGVAPDPDTSAAFGPGASGASGASGAEGRWIGVLRRLDARRQRAWLTDRPGLLVTVFAPGSRPLTTDSQALRAYRDRGFVVDGARMRFWDPRVVTTTADSVRLRVSDRLGPSTVVRGGAATPLPRDRPSRHLITLVDTALGWRIGDIRAE